MKKKNLLKTLVIATPLLGVLSPLGSCTGTSTNAHINNILSSKLSSSLTYDATISLFGGESISLPKTIGEDAHSFSISIPSGWHGKKISKAMWITKTEFEQKAHHWRTCKIVPISDETCELTTELDEKDPINDDIVINVERVEPISSTIGTFQNDTWDDLAYWTGKVYNGPGDDEYRANKLREIYALPGNEDFVGLERTVTFGRVKHNVVVASTFQLEKIKSGHTKDFPLDSDYVDHENHAAFTFQFKNLLTKIDEKTGEQRLVTHKFDTDKDADAQCWIEDGSYSGFHSSDLRKYLNNEDGDYKFYPEFDASENLVEHIMPVAKKHWVNADTASSVPEDHYQTYCSDRFFVPTALQMNSQHHPWTTFDFNWHTEENGSVSEFELYANKENTDGPIDYRTFTGVGLQESNDYWLASPCTDHEVFWWEPENTLVGQTNGSIGDRDCNQTKVGILLCFSI